tara:strand:- start:199 stop:933 length:735 start_codon:yes stop_codon:yes gene_type:complete
MEITVIPTQKEFKKFLEHFPPILSNSKLPDWYKTIPRGNDLDFYLNTFHDTGPLTAKACPAIQDTLTAGIIIPLWSKLAFRTTRDDEGNIKEQRWDLLARNATGHNLEIFLDQHAPEQLKGLELKKNVNNTVLKLQLPYYIKVPDGYNIFYTDPFYHFRQDIRCLPGIVEGDKWGTVAFPFEILKDNFIIEPGTPLVQAYIFKREKEKIDLNVRDATPEEQEDMDNKQFHLRNTGQNYRTNKNP